jgi:hypothetical protein
VKPRVLLATTSRWYPAARLAMALAKAGCDVEAVCPVFHPLRKTRCVRALHVYHGLAPLMSFARAIEITNPDLIIPGDDLATQHLHSLYNREQNKGKASAIGALIERSLGEPASFSVVAARAAFMRLARESGIRVPPTQVVDNASDLRKWVAQHGFPFVLKANGTSGGDGVRIVHTLAAAERALAELKAPPLMAKAAKRALVDHDHTLVWPSLLRRPHVVNAQAFVAGREATSTIACWKGAVLAGLHFEVINKVGAVGHATVVRLIENNEMAIAADRIVSRLGLSGLYGFDFMIETKTGKAHLIEVNPRSTQVGHLDLGPRRDIPAAVYAALSGNPVRTVPRVTENDTIALFPQEWKRDPQSAFLLSGHHDIPWEEPELIQDCVNGQRMFYPFRKLRNRRAPSPVPHCPNPSGLAPVKNVGLRSTP